VDDQHIEAVATRLRHQLPAGAEGLASVPRGREYLAHQFGLVTIVIEYGNSHGGGEEVLMKRIIVSTHTKYQFFLLQSKLLNKKISFIQHIYNTCHYNISIRNGMGSF
jgi:hypothetical protein